MPPPRGAPKVPIAPQLPPLPKLRVRQPNKSDANPCMGVMSSVLGCWASSGQAHEGCQILEQQLRACMDAPKSNDKKRNDINKHLGRMYPRLRGPTKKGK